MDRQIPQFPFSNAFRNDRVNASLQTTYDLIVIGGGITGAGIAYDATQRGLKTLLLEKKDFASGTSSKSTKLIHGGLRYLKQLEFGLVKETGLERAIAHRNICHLVHPEQMLLPIVKDGSFNTFTASMAISMYDMLAKVPKPQRKQRLSKAETLAIAPLLKESIVTAGISYAEYRTDDARLTVELIKSSRNETSEAFNYMEVQEFAYINGKITRVICKDEILDKTFTFKANAVVSAAGPWVDILREKDDSSTTKNLHLSKGVHIVIAKQKFPIETSCYFDVFDGRMIFAIPRGNVVYVGTTDDTFHGDINDVACTKSDAEYLLAGINNMFDSITLTLDDVESTWSGLRPLIQQEGKSAKELSRKDEIFVADSGLISIAGGKLTGYRKMAKRIVNLVIRKNSSLPRKRCNTRNSFIHNKPFYNYSEFQEYLTEIIQAHPQIPQYDLWHLITTFGKEGKAILIKALSDNSSLSISEKLVLYQLEFALDHESVYHPLDFFTRRTGWMYFDIKKVVEHASLASSKIADKLSTQDQLQKQLTDVSLSIDKHSLAHLKSK